MTTIKNADAPVTTKGTHACPGVLGGVEWNGPAYHPGANALVVVDGRIGPPRIIDMLLLFTLLVGSVRLTPVRIGETPALLLGPLTIEPPFRDRGIGKAMMERALADAKQQGHRLVVLVGDETYYKRVGFKRVPGGAIKMPGPADPARILAAELVEGALAGVSGVVRPDWDSA